MITDTLNNDLKRFLAYWHEKRGQNPIPARSDIDPMDLRSLLSGICILDLEYANAKLDRVKIRLAGTQFYQMIGYEITGRYIDEILPTAQYSKFKHQLTESIENLTPIFQSFEWEDGPLSNPVYHQILAPLGEHGKPIEQYIGMHSLVDRGGSSRPSQLNARFVA